MAVSTLGGGGSVSSTQSLVQAITITPVADVAAATSGQYFLLSSIGNDFYFWNNVSGASLDPKVPGKTGIQVVYNSGSVATVIAAAIVTAIQLTGLFNANVSAFNSAIVQVAATQTGVPLNPATAGTSTWTVTPVQTGVGIAAAGTSSAESFTITTIADVASSTNSKYFLMSSSTTNYYVWNNVSGAGVDPAIAGRTGISIAYAANASASTIATALQAAIAAGTSSQISASISLSVNVTFTTAQTAAVLTIPQIGTSSFTLARVRQGFPTNKSFVGGPFTVTLFTTPATANYTYEVEVFVSPASIAVTGTTTPAAGIEWAFVGNNLKQVSTTADQSFYPATGQRIATGGWRTIKCGPSTPVTVTGFAFAAAETYTISYNYVGYLIT